MEKARQKWLVSFGWIADIFASMNQHTEKMLDEKPTKRQTSQNKNKQISSTRVMNVGCHVKGEKANLCSSLSERIPILSINSVAFYCRTMCLMRATRSEKKWREKGA